MTEILTLPKNQIVYIYTTKTYLKNKWFKIGMTTQNGGAEERIGQQDGTSNPEPLEKQYELDLKKPNQIYQHMNWNKKFIDIMIESEKE
jgi:hypothetical protein